jgi:hypothetical protein
MWRILLSKPCMYHLTESSPNCTQSTQWNSSMFYIQLNMLGMTYLKESSPICNQNIVWNLCMRRIQLNKFDKQHHSDEILNRSLRKLQHCLEYNLVLWLPPH